MALSCDPRLIIADEPTTALDVTIQAQILHELADLCRESGTSLILVTHDFGVVAELADRVAVMYGGRVVEQAPVTELFDDPQHPYTWGLLGSVPRVDRPRSERLPTIAGTPPSLVRPPLGCHFKPRCPHRFARCEEVPPLVSRLPDQPEHRDRCWLEVDEKRRERVGNGEIGLREEGRRVSTQSVEQARPPLLAVDHLKLYFPVKSGVVLDRVASMGPRRGRRVVRARRAGDARARR